MNLIDSFNNLINNISPLSVILAAYGLVLLITAFIKSSYGVYAFTGSVSLAASVALRVLNGGTLAEVFIMVFIILILITVFFIATVRLNKYGWIIRMPLEKVKEGLKELHLKDKE